MLGTNPFVDLRCTMAIASTSWKVQDQSTAHDKHMLHLNDTLYNDLLLLSSGCSAEFDHAPQSSSSVLDSLDDLQQQRFTGNGKRIFFPETAALSPFTSAGVSSEPAHVLQGWVGSYPASQHLPTVHESFGRGLPGDYGSLGSNELSDFWGDLRLFSQELATYAVVPPQKLLRNEGSTFCLEPGDPVNVNNTISVDLHSPSGQRGSFNYPIPTTAEKLALEGTDLESPRPLQRENNQWPCPVETSLASVCFDSTLVDHGSSRSFEPEDISLPQTKPGHQPEILDKTLSPAACRKSGFQSQSVAGDRVLDVTRVKQFSDAVYDSRVTLGSRQQDFLQGYQPRERNIGGKAHKLRSKNLRDPPKLKQKSKERPCPPRKYQRRRIIHSEDMKDDVSSVPTPVDHVQRERQRRDLMTSKIAELELLLPKSSRRDRVSVVYDAIELLRRLEREVKDLQKKFDAKKLRRARHTHPGKVSVPKSTGCNLRTSGNCFSNEAVIKRLGTYMKPIDVLNQPTRGTRVQSRPTQRYSMISSARSLGDCQIREQENVFVEIQVHLDNGVRVEQENLVKVRCRKDYLNTMMDLVNEFQLDVSTCNIVKLSGYFICVMGIKTRTGNKTTAALFAVRLKSALIIARESVKICLSGTKCSTA